MVPYDHRVFRGNGLFDPDASGIGHQPFGFDQWCSATSFYTRYRVLASTIRIKFINEIAIGAFVAVYPSQASGAPATWGNAAEVPRSVTGYVGPASGYPITQITNTCSTRQMFGYKDITQEDLLSSLYSADPPLQWFWNTYLWVADETTHAVYAFSVEVHYDVEFYDRGQLGQS
jgi:hypothetical protein